MFSTVDTSGNVYVAGYFYGTADFNPDSGVVDNHTSAGNQDFFITRFSPIADTDGDGVFDNLDNCTQTANLSQIDTDGDKYGNACDGDFDQSGTVDLNDYFTFLSLFGSVDANADFNENGTVDLNDYFSFLGMFGQPPGPSGIAP